MTGPKAAAVAARAAMINELAYYFIKQAIIGIFTKTRTEPFVETPSDASPEKFLRKHLTSIETYERHAGDKSPVETTLAEIVADAKEKYETVTKALQAAGVTGTLSVSTINANASIPAVGDFQKHFQQATISSARTAIEAYVQTAHTVRQAEMAATPHAASGAADQPPAPDEPETDPTDGSPKYELKHVHITDHHALAGTDRQIQNATNNAFSSASEIFEQLDKAQREIIKLRSRPAVANDKIEETGEFPEGRIALVPAWQPFSDVIPRDKYEDFNFKIPVYDWQGRHPLVPEPMLEYYFNIVTLRRVLWAISTHENVAIHGPTGCGKTEFTKQIAARLRRPFFRIAFDGEMRRREIIGGFEQIATPTGSETKWFDGVMTQAITQPAILDLDEIDRADPDLQYVAHQVYEGKGITLLEARGRHIPRHPHLQIIATSNTLGRDDGENLYQLRSDMSEATRDRFPFWVEFDYLPEDREVAFIAALYPRLKNTSAERLVKMANLMRNSFKTGQLGTTCSVRQLKSCVRYAIGAPPRYTEIEREVLAVQDILLARAPTAHDRATIAEHGQVIFGSDWKTPTQDAATPGPNASPAGAAL